AATADSTAPQRRSAVVWEDGGVKTVVPDGMVFLGTGQGPNRALLLLRVVEYRSAELGVGQARAGAGTSPRGLVSGHQAFVSTREGCRTALDSQNPSCGTGDTRRHPGIA